MNEQGKKKKRNENRKLILKQKEKQSWKQSFQKANKSNMDFLQTACVNESLRDRNTLQSKINLPSPQLYHAN